MVNMHLIKAEGLSKHIKVLNHREGLVGAMKDLFSTDFRIVKAVDDISSWRILCGKKASTRTQEPDHKERPFGG